MASALMASCTAGLTSVSWALVSAADCSRLFRPTGLAPSISAVTSVLIKVLNISLDVSISTNCTAASRFSWSFHALRVMK